jgi:predicted alpha/beta-hydrolase family hydrolase
MVEAVMDLTERAKVLIGDLSIQLLTAQVTIDELRAQVEALTKAGYAVISEGLAERTSTKAVGDKPAN